MVGARLRVPSIVALIAAGVIAGPRGVGLMTSQEDVDLLAEIGVALLLFTAGLEFSLDELRRTWRTIVPGGLAQVGTDRARDGGGRPADRSGHADARRRGRAVRRALEHGRRAQGAGARATSSTRRTGG